MLSSFYCFMIFSKSRVVATHLSCSDPDALKLLKTNLINYVLMTINLFAF